MKDEEESTMFFLLLIKVLLHVQGTSLFDFIKFFSFLFFLEGGGWGMGYYFYNNKIIYQTYQYMTSQIAQNASSGRLRIWIIRDHDWTFLFILYFPANQTSVEVKGRTCCDQIALQW